MNTRSAYRLWLILACSSVALVVPAVTQAQFSVMPSLGTSDGIAVYGTGELSARPNLVEIDLHITGRAELTGDALVKYRDSKKRVLDALEKLKLPALSTDELALSITAGSSVDQQQRMMNGMPQTPGKTQIEVSSTLRLRLKDVREIPADELIKTVGKLLDVAQDSGVTIGPSPAEVMRNMRYGNYNNTSAPVRFVVADLAEIREKAYELAVADARKRAGRLAKLNQVKIGSALSVQEIQIAGDQQSVNAVNINIYGQSQTTNAASDVEEPRISSTNLSGIAVQVKLLARFAIQPPDPATAQQ